jgi:hypothetical protein
VLGVKIHNVIVATHINPAFWKKRKIRPCTTHTVWISERRLPHYFVFFKIKMIQNILVKSTPTTGDERNPIIPLMNCVTTAVVNY